MGAIANGEALMQVLESITDAVYMLDQDWRFAYLNASTEALLGRPREALLHGDFWALFPETRGTSFEAELRHAVATGIATTFETFASTRGIRVGVRAFPTPTGLMVVVQDITAQKAARDDLMEPEKRYRTLMQHISDIITIVDSDGTIRYESPAVTRVLGYTPEELLGTNAYDLVHPADVPELLALAQAAGDTPGIAPAVTVRMRARDDTWRCLEAVSTNLLADPTIRGYVITARDITARRAAEEALRASEASLAEAQRLAHVGSWEYDFVRDAFSWSDEVFRIAGYAPQSFVPTSETLMALVHPDDRQLILDGLASSLAGHPPTSLEHRIVRPDGTVRIIYQRAEIRRDAEGRPLKQIGIMLDITRRKALEALLLHRANHDPLTGLPNRALLRERLGQALERAERSGRPCALLFLDLDHFKTVNDSLGHATGDRLLVDVAARLRGALRAGDTLARFGGDEFVALLSEVVDLDEARAMAERLHVALAPPVTVDGHEFAATASIGVVLGNGMAEGPEELLRFADLALYRAKADGRARTASYNSDLNTAALARLSLEVDLRRAVERGELVLHYQPKVDLRTGAIAGLEALVRWQHPTRGLISPGVFIPLAEETGAIVPIGRWVLGEACRQVVAWQVAYPTNATPRLSVNLSARQFRAPDLVADVAALLAETGLAAELLQMEITETAAMERPDEAITTLTALRALGVRLAIDDFGTGYSSLAYLRQLPVDTLKIDRSFFADEERNQAIVRAVTDLAHALGLEVVAEGVERAAQVAWARVAGCDRGQGYYFAHPLPAEQLAMLWAAGLTFNLPDEQAAGEERSATAERRGPQPSPRLADFSSALPRP